MIADADLIAGHIESDPYHPGLGEARLIASGVSVWAVIGHLVSVDGNIDQAAADYDLSPDEMAAALAYYRLHRTAIDLRLAANASGALVDSTLLA
jgi:uncharacterized protein (DUF433 family)